MQLFLIFAFFLIRPVVAQGIFLHKLIFKPQYQFTAVGTDISILQTLNNCLSYNVCKPIKVSIEEQSDPNGNIVYAYHNQIQLNQNEYLHLIEKCPIDTFVFKVNVSLKDRNGAFKNISTPKFHGQRTVQDVYKIEKIDSQTKEYLASALDYFKSSNKYQQALDFFSEILKIPMRNYRLIFQKHKLDDLGTMAQVNHSYNKAEFTINVFSNVCQLYKFMRHEAEHIRQREHALACHKNQRPNPFNSKDDNEHYVYLNDIRMFKAFCKDEPFFSKAMETTYLKMFKDRYFVY